MGRAGGHCWAQQQPRAARRAKQSLWGAQEGETCHHCSHGTSLELGGSPQRWGSPGCPRPPALNAPNTHWTTVLAPAAAKLRGARLLCPPQDPAGPTSACGELVGPGGTPARGCGRAGCWETPYCGSKREKPEKAACGPSRCRPVAPGLPRRPPHPGCTAIFGSLQRAPLRLLIMRVRNSFGLSYIRKGRGSEAAKYTGACGSKWGGFGTGCGKEIVGTMERRTQPAHRRTDYGAVDGGRWCPWACPAALAPHPDALWWKGEQSLPLQQGQQ